MEALSKWPESVNIISWNAWIQVFSLHVVSWPWSSVKYMYLTQLHIPLSKVRGIISNCGSSLLAEHIELFSGEICYHS